VVDNYLKEKHAVSPTWKMSQSGCAVSAEELLTDVGDSDVKHVRLVPFNRLDYTVIRATHDSDSDRLLSIDDDPGFDAETVWHVRHAEDSRAFSSNTA